MQVTTEKIRKFATDPAYARYVMSTQSKKKVDSMRVRLWGLAPPPKMVILQITGNCNLTCRMCNQWGEDGGYHGIPVNQLTLGLGTIEQCLDEVEEFHPYVQLLGGEPPLHPEFDAVIHSLTERGLSASLETNGTTLEHWGGKLIGSTIDTLNVSIDGPREIHDKVRMREGTYDQALRGIKKVFQLRSEAGIGLPRINIRMTVTPENHDRILDTIEDFKELPISQFIIQHLLYSHPGVLRENAELLRPIKPGHEEIKVGGLFKPPDLDGQRVWDQIEEATRPERYGFQVIANPAYKKEYVRDYYRDAALLPDPGLTCKIPTDVLSINCQEEVSICSHFYVGKLGDGSLEELWNGTLARDFRKLLTRRGSIPACKICCYPVEA